MSEYCSLELAFASLLSLISEIFVVPESTALVYTVVGSEMNSETAFVIRPESGSTISSNDLYSAMYTFKVFGSISVPSRPAFAMMVTFWLRVPSLNEVFNRESFFSLNESR